MQGLNLRHKVVAIDTETTGLNPYGDQKRWGFYPARPFAFSFCDPDGHTAYVRWQVDPKTRRVIPESKSFKEMQSIFADPLITKVGHNFAYDLRMIKFSGFKFAGRIEDTLIMGHVVTGGNELSYALKPLAIKYLNFPDDDEAELQTATIKARHAGKKNGWCLATKEMMGKEPIKADYWMAPPEVCKRYAVGDAERTMMLYLLWKEEVSKDPMKFIYEKEMSLFYVVRKMEERGVRVFPENVDSLYKFYQGYMKQQLATANRHGGKGLNFRSPKQMTQKFFVEKGHQPKKFTDAGNPKLDGEILAELAEKDPLAKAILEYRGAGHMLSAFLDPYKRFMVQEDPSTWVLHTNYRQCGPITGRFSAGDPNLMQVASETTGRRKTDITLRPREAMGPRKGYVWYLPDYSQVEVWAFSFLAQESIMMKTLIAGHDYHGSIAEELWGRLPDYKEKKSYYRKRAKLIMFCKLYGGGTKKIASLLECSVNEAQLFVDQYDSKLPGVKRFMKRMITQAEREGKISNAFGRLYYLPPNFAYRAVNYLVQGTCADIMKQAMINVDKIFSSKWKGCHMLLTLHDELVLEIPLSLHCKKLMRDIIVAMQGDFHKRLGMPCPLPVSMKIAKKRWSETIEIEGKDL